MPAMFNQQLKQPRPLWKQVKEIEEDYNPEDSSLIKQIDATLMVNYGPKGSAHRGIIEVNEGSTLSKLLKVLEWYENQLDQKEELNE